MLSVFCHFVAGVSETVARRTRNTAARQNTDVGYPTEGCSAVNFPPTIRNNSCLESFFYRVLCLNLPC